MVTVNDYLAQRDAENNRPLFEFLGMTVGINMSGLPAPALPLFYGKEAAAAEAVVYNNERPHMSLDWKTPSEAALCTGELKKKWVSRRENFIKAEVA